MEVIKKYTAIDVSFDILDKDSFNEESFDTEEEDIEWAYNRDRYSSWLIVPRVEFKNS